MTELLVKGLTEEQMSDGIKKSEIQKLRESLENHKMLKDICELLDYQYAGEFTNKMLLFFLCVGTLIKEPFGDNNINCQSIVIVGENAELRNEFVYSVLDLFPKDIVCEYHLTGLSKLANKDMEGKKILYISNFDSKINQDIIKMIKNVHTDIEYNLKKETKIIPKITTITTTTKDKLLKNPEVFENSIVMEIYDIRPYFDSNHFLSNEMKLKKQKESEAIKRSIRDYITTLSKKGPVAFEISCLNALWRLCINYHVSNAESFYKKFEYLVKSITLFSRENRLHYYINNEGDGAKIPVYLTYPTVLWYALKLGECVLNNNLPDMPKAQQDFLNFMIRFIENDKFLQNFKNDKPLLDGNGYFRGHTVIDAYIFHLNGRIDGNNKEVQNFKRTLRWFFSNLSDTPCSCLELKKEGKINFFRFKNIPCIRPFVFEDIKSELLIEYFEHIDTLTSKKF